MSFSTTRSYPSVAVRRAPSPWLGPGAGRLHRTGLHRTGLHRTRLLRTGVATLLAVTALACTERGAPRRRANREHLSAAAWTQAEWAARCRGARTSYNPSAELTDERLTLVPGDPRWLDFLYWALNNKVAEHQAEAYGGTGWDGPKGGVVFHWAPGSHWERDTLASFGFTIGHTIGEHRWMDTMFPDFFEKYGGVFGVNLKDRLAELDPQSPAPWVEFLAYTGGEKSPYYRYLFHQEAVIEPAARQVHFIGGQGVAFSYGFERYYHELSQVLTDCRSVDFFEMYDLFGPGFAAQGNWARQDPPDMALSRAGYGEAAEVAAQTTVNGESPRYQPAASPVAVPEGLPERDAMERGKSVYLAQCVMCHGAKGDGNGFLAAGLDVAPRDFRQGLYKLRRTATGELPAIADLERVIRRGMANSTMPAWGQFLSDQEIADVARYLIVFSEDFARAWRNGKVPRALVATRRPDDLPALAARGQEVYRTLECAQCHGAAGFGDGPAARSLEDAWRRPSRATDLSYRWSFIGGNEPEDIYHAVVGGLNGTPMPAYEAALPDEPDRWALVAYVLSLSPEERPALRRHELAAQRKERIGPRGRVLPRPHPTTTERR